MNNHDYRVTLLVKGTNRNSSQSILIRKIMFLLKVVLSVQASSKLFLLCMSAVPGYPLCFQFTIFYFYCPPRALSLGSKDSPASLNTWQRHIVSSVGPAFRTVNQLLITCEISTLKKFQARRTTKNCYNNKNISSFKVIHLG